MNNITYDQVIPLAENVEGEVISASRYGSNWYFIYENKADRAQSGRIGGNYQSQYEILEASENYITSESGYEFNRKDLLKIKDKRMVFLSDSQLVSISTAINLLSDSNSDHAEQAVFYMKQIVK
tara:strand:- start:605 stop:976 length:372 start_codon:yes stop_codon:yes gene_type:complete